MVFAEAGRREGEGEGLGVGERAGGRLAAVGIVIDDCCHHHRTDDEGEGDESCLRRWRWEEGDVARSSRRLFS